METVYIQGKKHRIGRCIYCLSQENLSDEHAVPFSLGGDITLEDASCDRCAGITSYLDGYLARHVFHEFRTHRGLQSRRGLPKELPATLIHGEQRVRTLLPVSDHPFAITLPNFGSAGILRGEPPRKVYGERTNFWSWGWFPESMTAEGIRVEITYNVGTFARAIAKAAYCHAVLMHGLGGFRSLWMSDLILGRYPYPLYLVGSDELQPLSQQMPQHELWFGDATNSRQKLEDVSLRLFGNAATRDGIGLPVYHVVMGVLGEAVTRVRRRVPVLPKTIAL